VRATRGIRAVQGATAAALRRGGKRRLIALASALLAVGLASRIAAADELVVRLDGLLGAAGSERPLDSEGARTKALSRLPMTLRLPVTTSAEGAVTISLRQEILDASVDGAEGPRAVRPRVLSPATGSVIEDASGALGIAMDTALAIDDPVSGKTKIFDVRIRGNTEADATYGAALPLYVEAWRRGPNGEPAGTLTKENRSFWGTVSAHFED
jgi:hypothetical protein